jgi:hypothetical protein
MEPRFRGSASLVEAGCGFTTSSMLGAALPHRRLAGLRVEPELELLLEPCQTGPE